MPSLRSRRRPWFRRPPEERFWLCLRDVSYGNSNEEVGRGWWRLTGSSAMISSKLRSILDGWKMEGVWRGEKEKEVCLKIISDISASKSKNWKTPMVVTRVELLSRWRLLCRRHRVLGFPESHVLIPAIGDTPKIELCWSLDGCTELKDALYRLQWRIWRFEWLNFCYYLE